MRTRCFSVSHKKGIAKGVVKMSEIKTLTLLKDNARIGIINRGEPACRFIRSVREYNNLNSCSLKSIAFYIGKEEDSLFVRNSDESYLLQDKPGSLLSGAGHYLDHDLIINALKTADCDAVWVGWGFVSEDSVFAEKIEQEGLVFLGPSSRAMALLGDKITAKDLAEKSDVPVLPWSGKPVSSLEEAEKIAEAIGYPVIIKASNAGGGRGIRIVETPEVLPSRYSSALEETVRITGNDILFMECFVEKGRHLEVQVIADYHGNINTLGVRDCSVQRNNQKIIEETPPPCLGEDITAAMEEASCRLMKVSGYAGAGTVEYLYDLKRNQFYFMEVNTRLQVEHPITEILYGFDLVKGQIDVAMGKEVVVGNEKSAGAVIEVRLNAEDPYSGFTPSPGDVLLFAPPAGPGIRVDSGIEQNSSIPSDFDSMVAKIIAFGKDRDEALARIKRAVEELRIKIRNGTTNKSFILDLLSSPEIIRGGIHTGFVKEYLGFDRKERSFTEEEAAILASAVEIYLRHQKNEIENFRNQISRSGTPRALSCPLGEKIDLSYNGIPYSLYVRYSGSGYYHISCLDKNLVCRYRTRGEESVIEVGNGKYNMILTDRGDTIQCDINGLSIPVSYQAGGVLKSRSPAIVLSINAVPGSEVEKGDPLVVLEAMKMEMIIQAPVSGIVNRIYISEGEQIAAGQPLVLIDEKSDSEEKKTGSPVLFTSVLAEGDIKRKWLERELLAFFLGYDNDRKPEEVWSDYIKAALSDNEMKEKLPDIIINILDFYIRIEKLFSAGEVVTELFSRPVSYTEMLSHYFRIKSEKEKGLPEEFLEDVNRAAGCFVRFGEPDTASLNPDFCFFNIFRSHKNRISKDRILKLMFSDFDKIVFPETSMEKLISLLDEIINLFPSSQVYDYALSARYSVFDRKKLEEVKTESRNRLESVIKRTSSSERIPEHDLEFIVDCGSYIMPELLELALSTDSVTREHGFRFAGLRFNRDRVVHETSFFMKNNTELFSALVDEKGQRYKSYLSVLSDSDIVSLDAGLAEKCCSKNSEVPNELVILLKCSSPCSSIFSQILENLRPSHINLTIGLYTGNNTSCYRSFSLQGNEWVEAESMRNFSPLQYRELKVERFSGFSLEILYRNEGVFVAEVSSKSNPDDVRLVSFVDVSELLPSETDSSERLRLLMFEALFNEAANALRSLQTRYKKKAALEQDNSA